MTLVGDTNTSFRLAMNADELRAHARSIWDAAVAAVRPEKLVRQAVSDADSPLASALATAGRILVVGGGKAGMGMAAGLEAGLAGRLDRVKGIVNVPAGGHHSLSAIRAAAVRPAGTNEPTPAAVDSTHEMLTLVRTAIPGDVIVCLLSGGGSALLPAPAEGITLDDKQAITRLLHACGATIGEMNCVRKHLSRFKGGGLALASNAGRLITLIISDVVGDSLDVIASGPTAPDPTTFADALSVLRRYDLLDRVPSSVKTRFARGAAGGVPETLKALPPNVHNLILGNNARALAAAAVRAQELGYRVLNLGSFVEGEAREVGTAVVGIARSIAADREPLSPPACVLIGGETTVTLPTRHGKGGRNTEFVLAAIVALDRASLDNVVVLSGGTDGEDGPTDAAGAVADSSTVDKGRSVGLDATGFLRTHDSYTYFEALGDLLRPGLTGTNVMDVRLVLVG
jgi:hydroxypyruvate reductase/glycerate 2-kinase